MKLFKEKEEARSVGRPKLADDQMKKKSFIMLGFCFAIVMSLLLTLGYQLNIIPSLSKVKGTIVCQEQDIPAALKYDENTNPTGFRDINFYNAVVNSISSADTSTCTSITPTQLESIEVVYGSNKEIRYADGIQRLTGLKHLYLNENEITEIDLSENKLLKTLEMASNGLTELNLEENEDLMNLYLTNNSLERIDLSLNTALHDADLTYNNFEEIILGENENFSSLSVSYNSSLASLDISGLSSLYHFSARNTALGNINFSGNPNINNIDLTLTNITDLNLSANNNLYALTATRTPLETVTFSSSTNNELHSVELFNNKLRTINNLQNNPNLYVLEVYSNELTSLSLEGLTSLAVLQADHNKLESVTIDSGARMTTMRLNNNKLSDLNILNSREIITLELMYNEFTSLNLGSLVVSGLDIDHNKLESINFGSTVPEGIDVSFNNLTSLDVSAFPNLRSLNANDNNLTSIIIGNNTEMFNLNLENNDLTEIDLSGTTNITSFKYDKGMDFCRWIKVGKSIEYKPKVNLITAYPNRRSISFSPSGYITYNDGYLTAEQHYGNWSTSSSHITMTDRSYLTSGNNSATQNSDRLYTYKVESSVYTVDEEAHEINFGGDTIGDIETTRGNFTGLTNVTVEYDGDKFQLYTYQYGTSEHTKLEEYTMKNYKLVEISNTDSYYGGEPTDYIIDNDAQTINMKGDLISNASRLIVKPTPFTLRLNNDLNVLEVLDRYGDLYTTYTLNNYSLYDLSSKEYNIHDNIIDARGKIFSESLLNFKAATGYTKEIVGDNFIIYKPNGTELTRYEIRNRRPVDADAPEHAGFTDRNLYQCVLNTYARYADDMYLLTDKELSEIEHLECINKGITDATGLDKLSGLLTLELSYNELASIDLSGNKLLTRLSLRENDLSTMTGLDKLYDLTEINLTNNNLTSLDFSKNRYMTFLAIGNNNLSTVTGTSDKTLIGSFMAYNNENLKKVDLSSASELYMLNLTGTGTNNPIYVLNGTTVPYNSRVKLNSAVDYDMVYDDNDIISYRNHNITGLKDGTVPTKMTSSSILNVTAIFYEYYLSCMVYVDVDGDNEMCSGSAYGEEENLLTNDIVVFDITSDEYSINKSNKSINLKEKDFDPNNITITNDNLTGEVIDNKYVVKNGDEVVISLTLKNPKQTTTEPDDSTTTTSTTTKPSGNGTTKKAKKVVKKVVTKVKTIGGGTKTSVINKVIPSQDDDIYIRGTKVNGITLFALKGKDRNLIVMVDDNLKVIINGKNIKNINGDLDLSYTLTSVKKDKDLRSLFEDGLELKFKSHVAYNMMVELNIPNNLKEYLGGNKVNLYKYDDNLSLVGEKLKMSDNKYVFHIDTLGTYVLSNSLKDTTDLVENNLLISENSKVQARISNSTMLVILIDVIVALVIIGIIAARSNSHSNTKKIEA